jgi:hypothetical protein
LRRFHNEEFHSLHHSPNIVRVIKSRRLRSADHIARKEKGTIPSKMLTDKATGRRPLGMPRSRWEDNIRMDLKELYQTRN